jgi:hypothetical protein
MLIAFVIQMRIISILLQLLTLVLLLLAEMERETSQKVKNAMEERVVIQIAPAMAHGKKMVQTKL